MLHEWVEKCLWWYCSTISSVPRLLDPLSPCWLPTTYQTSHTLKLRSLTEVMSVRWRHTQWVGGEIHELWCYNIIWSMPHPNPMRSLIVVMCAVDQSPKFAFMSQIKQTRMNWTIQCTWVIWLKCNYDHLVVSSMVVFLMNPHTLTGLLSSVNIYLYR